VKERDQKFVHLCRFRCWQFSCCFSNEMVKSHVKERGKRKVGIDSCGKGKGESKC